MATYKSPLATAGQKAYTPSAGVSVVAYSEITTTTAATGDIYNMVPLPAGARIVNIIIGADQLDSNASPTLAISVGDSGSATRYGSSLTSIGRATNSTPVQTITYAGFGYQLPADDAILVTITAGAATYVAGKIRVYVEYMPAWY